MLERAGPGSYLPALRIARLRNRRRSLLTYARALQCLHLPLNLCHVDNSSYLHIQYEDWILLCFRSLCTAIGRCASSR